MITQEGQMKIRILLLACLITNPNYSQSNLTLIDPTPSLIDTTYQAPVFNDLERVKKIEAAFPIIENLYKEYAEKNNYPGLVFGLVIDGKLVFSGGTGYSDVENKIPVNNKSMFRIASMTKSFTALAIVKLRDEGKLDLDDPVELYIPEMKGIKYLTSDAPLITIEHLLTHTEGFPQDDPWGDRQLADTDEDLIQIIKNGISFSNTPGIAFEYSNLGFAILGKIITTVSGMPYQKYITDNILKPLEMNHTEWEYKNVPDNQLAQGYRWLNNKWNTEVLLGDGSFGSMGGLISSIEDFSKYIKFHLSAWPPRNEIENGIIKRSSLREMKKHSSFLEMDSEFKFQNSRKCPMVFSYSYGIGWSQDCEGRNFIGHSGGLPGFGSNWRIAPEYGIGVVAFANLTYAEIHTINWQVLDTLIRIAELRPRELPASKILIKRSNELLKLLPDWEDARTSKIFAENFFSDFILDSLINTCNQLYDSAGTILNIKEVEPQNQLRGTFILEGEKKNIEVFFTLTPENPPLIQYVEFKEKNRIDIE
jgi:CubicO group peptidase (beta-lactamase class C family)